MLFDYSAIQPQMAFATSTLETLAPVSMAEASLLLPTNPRPLKTDDSSVIVGMIPSDNLPTPQSVENLAQDNEGYGRRKHTTIITK
jgi:hypothetical protein